jgi:single-strand selective monofunctional uracil DNA glycosylase
MTGGLARLCNNFNLRRFLIFARHDCKPTTTRCVLAGIKYLGCALKPSDTSPQLIVLAQELSKKVGRLKFAPPVAYIYNPLNYAWPAHEKYLQKFGSGKKRVVFLGMNPGPFGMVQTGIPFGEVAAVRDWLKIHATIGRPRATHCKRPVMGFDCARSEVSGRRLWKLFSERFRLPEIFFREHFVVNYCPLAFLGVGGANLTPNKLPKSERKNLFEACDEHLQRVLEILQPEWLVGIGGFAFDRGETVAGNTKIRLGQILHPSPASPKANRQDWVKTATKELIQQGIWK